LIIEIVHIFFKMPRRKQFTEIEKGQIVAYRAERRGYKYIDKKMGRSYGRNPRLLPEKGPQWRSVSAKKTQRTSTNAFF
jgi:hypothetical protein